MDTAVFEAINERLRLGAQVLKRVRNAPISLLALRRIVDIIYIVASILRRKIDVCIHADHQGDGNIQLLRRNHPTFALSGLSQEKLDVCDFKSKPIIFRMKRTS